MSATRQCLRWTVLLVLLAIARATPLQQATCQGKRGAVASESSVCSQAGIEMIEMGGNAADALVATVFCVGVIGMYHSG